jgi:hypothetical protein
MNFVPHSTNNMILNPPVGMQNCDPLPATMMINDNQTVIASFWMPTSEELAALNAGQPVVLHVWGTMHPPVAIGVAP